MRVRELRVRPFSITPSCRQPHSVFGGYLGVTLLMDTHRLQNCTKWILWARDIADWVRRLQKQYQVDYLDVVVACCSSVEHSEGHPVCAPIPVRVQVQVHCIG